MNVHTLDDRILTIPITEVIRYSLNHYTHTSQGGIGHGFLSYWKGDVFCSCLHFPIVQATFSYSIFMVVVFVT